MLLAGFGFVMGHHGYTYFGSLPFIASGIYILLLSLLVVAIKGKKRQGQGDADGFENSLRIGAEAGISTVSIRSKVWGSEVHLENREDVTRRNPSRGESKCSGKESGFLVILQFQWPGGGMRFVNRQLFILRRTNQFYPIV